MMRQYVYNSNPLVSRTIKQKYEVDCYLNDYLDSPLRVTSNANPTRNENYSKSS